MHDHIKHSLDQRLIARFAQTEMYGRLACLASGAVLD